MIFLAQTLPAHSHRHHTVNGTLETSFGYYSMLWNTAELALHSAELFGYKGGCSHGCGHHHGSFPERIYHSFEIATHALNSFEATAHLSENFSDWLSQYVSTGVSSMASILANGGIVLYRAKDLNRGIKTTTKERRFLPAMMSTWFLADMIGHLSAIYFGLQDQAQ
ncbi:MAG: hypothetical protein I8H72_00830 [Myxococcaceae bacterium]|nr:hypothetical protein [Myxococcaceae bacterium]